eukprot:gene442-1083_t
MFSGRRTNRQSPFSGRRRPRGRGQNLAKRGVPRKEGDSISGPTSMAPQIPKIVKPEEANSTKLSNDNATNAKENVKQVDTKSETGGMDFQSETNFEQTKQSQLIENEQDTADTETDGTEPEGQVAESKPHQPSASTVPKDNNPNSSANGMQAKQNHVPEEKKLSQSRPPTSAAKTSHVVSVKENVSRGSALKSVEKSTNTEERKINPSKSMNHMVDLSSLIKPDERRFSTRGKLFIANLNKSSTKEDLEKLFGKFGDTSEAFVNNEKGFGFIHMDYRINAEIAKSSLDGTDFKGRTLRIKYAAPFSAIEVHGIDQFCSNESVATAFGKFGSVERARIVCDERGKSKGYAIVEFAFKKNAQNAIQRVNEGLFVLGRYPKAVNVKPLAQIDEEGIHEKDIEERPGVMKDREYKARFIFQSSAEYQLTKKLNDFDTVARERRETFERELREQRREIELEIENFVEEREDDYVRQALIEQQKMVEEELRRHEQKIQAARKRQANAMGQGLGVSRHSGEGRDFFDDSFGMHHAANNRTMESGGDSMMRGGSRMQRMPGGPPGHGQGPPQRDQGPPQRGQGPPQREQGPPQRGQGPPQRDQGPPQRGQGPPLRGRGPPTRGRGEQTQRLMAQSMPDMPPRSLMDQRGLQRPHFEPSPRGGRSGPMRAGMRRPGPPFRDGPAPHDNRNNGKRARKM